MRGGGSASGCPDVESDAVRRFHAPARRRHVRRRPKARGVGVWPPVVADIDQLSSAISHATAPAFMLGAVAGFLSILIARLERVGERSRALRLSDAGDVEPSVRDAIAASFARRRLLLGCAILFAVLSALVTAALLIGAFLAALAGFGHGGIIAALFAVSLALLMASLVELTREIRVYMTHARFE
jgi:hypothetical protein